jgi:hypothetical protein
MFENDKMPGQTFSHLFIGSGKKILMAFSIFTLSANKPFAL